MTKSMRAYLLRMALNGSTKPMTAPTPINTMVQMTFLLRDKLECTKSQSPLTHRIGPTPKNSSDSTVSSITLNTVPPPSAKIKIHTRVRSCF